MTYNFQPVKCPDCGGEFDIPRKTSVPDDVADYELQSAINFFTRYEDGEEVALDSDDRFRIFENYLPRQILNKIDTLIRAASTPSAEDKDFWIKKWNDEVNTHAHVMRDNASLRGEVQALREALEAQVHEKLIMNAEKVFAAIKVEREYQDKKWGSNKPQSLAGYLLILESELAEAKKGWIKNHSGRNSPLAEIVQIAAVAVSCLERYGVDGSAIPTNDEGAIPEERIEETIPDSEAVKSFRKRWEDDNVDDMTEEQYGIWLDKVPREEFLALLKSMQDSEGNKNG